MNSETILFIVIAGVVAFGLALFMYGYRSKYTGNLRWIFGILRFFTIFTLLVLLINPKFSSSTYSVEKPKLAVLLDNSASVAELGYADRASEVLQNLKNDEVLNAEFDLSYFTFGSEFDNNDSLSFSEKNTQISKALKTANDIFRTETAPMLLVSDGNQTLGSDYEFISGQLKNSVYSVILGDSTKYLDLKIERLNTNRYAFLKNEFPVEVILVYSGAEQISTQFVVTQGNSTVYQRNLSFSEDENTNTLSFTLPANSVGLQKYAAQLIPLNEEKNKNNNVEQFAVEVIDQATNVLLVSEIVHPDLGAIQKSISANEQRRVTLMKPNDAIATLDDYQLVILYQPDRNFATLYSELNKLRKNTLTFTGMKTDWNFLNTIQKNFSKDASLQKDEVNGVLNMNFGAFAVEDIGFEGFPPLSSQFGELSILVPNAILLEQYINGIPTNTPLAATMEIDGRRHAIWDGEGIWMWRAQSFIDTESFTDFDTYLAKMVQYLASNKRRSRLEVSNKSFYYNNGEIRILSQYFDKNFVFDSRGSVSISVEHQETKDVTTYPMLLRNNYYEVDLDNLPSGDYRYTVSVRDESVARSGSFTILEFNVEQQFLNADVTKMRQLATNTGGEAYFSNQIQELILSLAEDDRFQPIQKEEQKIVPLIDWKYLLGLLVLLLSIEWFIRKYNGLI